MNDDRFKEALDAIQEAQLLADKACRALCSVNEGWNVETSYSIACALSNHIKATWHKIELRRQQQQNTARINRVKAADMGAELP